MNYSFSILSFGKFNCDNIADVHSISLSADDFDADAKNRADRRLRYGVGGAVAKVSHVSTLLAKIFGDHCISKIITDVGVAPERSQFRDLEAYLKARDAHNAVFDLLRERGTRVIDLNVGRSGYGVASSEVINFGGNVKGGSGRAIFTDPKLKTVFGAVAKGFNQDAYSTVRAEMDVSDLVFVDTAVESIAKIAVDVATNFDKSNIDGKTYPYMVDYGEKEWPEDPDTAVALQKVIENADILTMPDDAKFKGTPNKAKDEKTGQFMCRADILFEHAMKSNFKARTIIVSNGLNPVRVYHDGEVRHIPIQPAENPVNTNGVGDTRDGALLFFLARGNDMFTAVEKASAVATIRMQYFGDEWTDFFLDHVLENERWSELFKEDIPKLKCMQWTAIARADEEEKLFLGAS